MSAEKSVPKLRLPENRGEQPLTLSPETAKASLEVARDAAAGKRPTKEQAASFVEHIAHDMERDGQPVAKESIHAVADQLTATSPENAAETVKLPSFEEITKTLEHVEKLYTTPDVRRKIKLASATMVGLEFILGAGQYAWQAFFDKVIGDKDELTVYSDLLHQWMQRDKTPGFKKDSFIAKVMGKTAGLWAPTVVNLAADQAIFASNKSLNSALGEVGNRINQRTTESLLLQKYAFIQDVPPSEVLNIIERGKMASIDLIASVRADAYPGMARVVSNLIPAWQINKIATAVGLGRLFPLYKTAEKQVKSLLMSRRKMYSEADLVDARIASLLSNLEIAQASGKSADVALQLQDAMREREEIFTKQRQKKTEREGSEKLWHFVFNRAAPIVVTATEYLQANNKIVQPLIRRQQEKSWINYDFFTYPGWDEASLQVKNKIMQEGQQHDFFDLVKKPNDSEKQKSDFSGQLAEAHIRAGALAYMKSQQFSGLQQGTAGEASRLTSIYANNLIPDLQDIAEMEKLLGPWDALDRPDGPRELKRISATTLKNLDISIKNLSVMGILNDVSFDIKQGEFVAIRAQKGEGKTTLLRAMLGLSQPENGSVSYGGVDIDGIKKFGPDALHSRFGYSPQSAGLIDTMTLKENLLLWNKEIPEETVTNTMRDLGLEKLIPRLNETGNHFSGGEKRLLSIVRALLTNPKILYLDEPTANLDPASIDRLVSTLKAIRKNHPETTIISVTHDEDFAKHTDRTINLAALNKKVPQQLGDHQVLEAIARP